MGLFRKIFPSRNDRRLKKINKIVDKIEALADTFKAMTDEELQGCTQKYIDRYNEGESLDMLGFLYSGSSISRLSLSASPRLCSMTCSTLATRIAQSIPITYMEKAAI